MNDYGKGGLTHVSEMIELARAAGKPVLVDPKGSDFSRYAGATAITPNRGELAQVIGAWDGEEQLQQRAHALRRSLRLQGLLLTRSEEGISLFDDEPAGGHLRLPTRRYHHRHAGRPHGRRHEPARRRAASQPRRWHRGVSLWHRCGETL